MMDRFMKKLKKKSNVPKDKLSLHANQPLAKSSLSPYPVKSSISPYALPTNPFSIRNTPFLYADSAKGAYTRQCHSKGHKQRPNLSSQKSNRNASMNRNNYFNTTFSKQNNNFIIQNNRARSDLMNYNRRSGQNYKTSQKANELLQLRNQTFDLIQYESNEDQRKISGIKNIEKRIPNIREDKHSLNDDIKFFNNIVNMNNHLPSLPKKINVKEISKTNTMENDTINPKEPSRKLEKSFQNEVLFDSLISFSGSKTQLRTECKEEERLNAEKIKPYAFIMDDLKPMFFFNVKGRTEEDEEDIEFDLNTPSFVESSRAKMPKEKTTNKTEICTFNVDEKGYCYPIINLGNEHKGNIYINKTTIINNIINSNKKPTPKRINTFKIKAGVQNPKLLNHSHKTK